MTITDMNGKVVKVHDNSDWKPFYVFHQRVWRVGEQRSLEEIQKYIGKKRPIPSKKTMYGLISKKNRLFFKTIFSVPGRPGFYEKVRRGGTPSFIKYPNLPEPDVEEETPEPFVEVAEPVQPELPIIPTTPPTEEPPVVPVVPEEVELIETFSAVVVLEFLSREERSIVMGLISRYVVEREYTHEKTRSLGETSMRNKTLKFGNAMKSLRTARQLTVAKAANGSGMSTMYMSEMERGLKTPSPLYLESICKFYEVSVTAMESLILQQKMLKMIDDSKNTDVILQLARKILLLEDETPEVALEVMALLKV